MQIDSLKIADFMRKTQEVGNSIGDITTKNPVRDDMDSNLRSIHIDSANYNKTGKSEKDFASELELAEAVTSAQKANIDFISREWGDEAIEKMEEDGLDAMSSDSHTFVTIVDEIKMSLAKGGKDISKMGGLSDEELRQMTGSVSAALAMASEISDTLSDASISYLVENKLEPTIENMYNASFVAPASLGEKAGIVEKTAGTETGVNGSIPNELIPRVNQTIEEAGYEVNDESMQIVSKMFDNGIAITADNINYVDELINFVKPDDSNEIVKYIEDALIEGREAKDAFMVNGYSLMDQAREIYNEVQSIDENRLSDVKAMRQLQEVRLMMTVEANFTILKNGFSINTKDIADMVEKLSYQEKEFERLLISENGESVSEEEMNLRISVFEETKEAVSEIKEMPAALLGRIPDINEATLRTIKAEGEPLKETFAKAQESYEALWTAPRRDMGDSLTKAFRNVDDILEDLNLEKSEINQKAVRILAYNQISITRESVQNMSNAADVVNRAFKALTPSVVGGIIKKGENPLDLKLEDLLKLAKDIKAENGKSEDEGGFAKFLWKAEHNHEITQEQRDAYVGIYRLINQVEKTDGAVVGALVHQGAEVTLRSLMTAVRNRKHSGREYEIDDNFGGLEAVKTNGLSVTEQIEAAFHINRLYDARETMTPVKMAGFETDEMMSMSPDQFAKAMEETEDAVSEETYRSYVKQQMAEAFSMEQRVSAALAKFDLPDSPNMITAIHELYANRNKAMRDLFAKSAEDLDKSIEDIIAEVTEEFGEDSKTPEEMAAAQKKLADLAENAMKNVLVEDKEITTIDFKGLKLIKTQFSAMSTMAEKEETYHMPIMVADEMGNMTLKIVRGKEQKGLAEIAFSTEKAGNVSANFRYEAGEIKASILCDKNATKDAFLSRSEEIISNLQEKTGLNITLSTHYKKGMDLSEIYETNADFETTKEKDGILTSALYSLSRAFIDELSSMIL